MFTNDVRRKPPETFKDLKDNNYTIYSFKAYEHDLFKDIFNLYVDKIDRYFVFNFFIIIIPSNFLYRPHVENLEFFDILEKFLGMSEPSLKAAIPSTKVDMRVMKNIYAKLPKTLNEYVQVHVQGICANHNNFFQFLSWKLSNDLASSGILKYWHDYFLDVDMKPLLEESRGPKVFDIEDLKFGFNVWLVACGISASTFFIEFFYFYVKIFIKKIVKSSIALYYLLSFFPRKNT
jgi:hypothetical protein